ncbi:MAG: glycosyl transferase family 2 [Planctomycetes bacterium]|jgi:glycosyltransferase involved in cell wall biosynthesis|nr:glycosyl transferase family 2 [Planctomycetota bacterium]MDP6410877.1 glycosyltransferase family 2 protein [Planctomycetota bacterium]
MTTQTKDRPSAPPGARTEESGSTQRRSADGVTIVVPAYNEEGGIGGVVDRLCALELGVPTELLIVDDGSSDGTAAALVELGARHPALTVVRHRENSGYGAALKTGFARARHDVVVITDADGTYPESSIAELLERIDDGADMAVGSRTGGDVHIPLIRRPAKAFLRWMASFLAGTPIPDLNSGLRAFRREFVLAYLPILPQGFSFTTTITLAALTNGHAVDYVRINYAAREGRSKIRPVRDTLGFLALILRTVLYFNPLKVFYPLAGVMVIPLALLLYRDLFLGDQPNLGDSTVVLFVAVVQILSVGLLADLIEKKARL